MPPPVLSGGFFMAAKGQQLGPAFADGAALHLVMWPDLPLAISTMAAFYVWRSARFTAQLFPLWQRFMPAIWPDLR
jgi:hypothetical protein